MSTLNQYCYIDILKLIKKHTIDHPKMVGNTTSTPSWYGVLAEMSNDDSKIQFGFSYPMEEPMMAITNGSEIGKFYISSETEELKFDSTIKKYQKMIPEGKSISLAKHIDIKFPDSVNSLLVEALDAPIAS